VQTDDDVAARQDHVGGQKTDEAQQILHPSSTYKATNAHILVACVGNDL
jgi:hypothetical protein